MSQLQNSRNVIPLILVIPAQAGIQSFQEVLDPRFRGGDSFFEFCNRLLIFDFQSVTQGRTRYHECKFQKASGNGKYSIMIDDCPSITAMRVAVRRAAHQLLDDDPKIFNDPLLLRILGKELIESRLSDPAWSEQTQLSQVLRASLAARSRFTEDELHKAVKKGVRQYVILGAGLDTFAYRNPYAGETLRVFEVDHPATQTWKRARLQAAGIPVPQNLTYAPIDFERQTLEDGLVQAEFKTGLCTFFSWLGVTPYLTGSAINATLKFVASMPAGSGIVFDYIVSPLTMSPDQLKVFNSLAHRVARTGEPFQTYFDPPVLITNLRNMGFGHLMDVAPEEMNARYFQNRKDGLRVGTLAHVMYARV
jgi:methyltransferase (TIGR00027 family)